MKWSGFAFAGVAFPFPPAFDARVAGFAMALAIFFPLLPFAISLCVCVRVPLSRAARRETKLATQLRDSTIQSTLSDTLTGILPNSPELLLELLLKALPNPTKLAELDLCAVPAALRVTHLAVTNALAPRLAPIAMPQRLEMSQSRH